MEQNIQTLGKRIAVLRKRSGMTQEQLAERVGVSAQAVSKWENDASCPDIMTLPLLADIFGVTIDELLGKKPIESHVVILEKEKQESQKKDHTFTFHWEPGVWNSIVGIIVMILVCTVLLLKHVTPWLPEEVSTWNLIWPILIFGVGLASVRSSVAFGIGAMLIGAYEFCWFALNRPDYLIKMDWYIAILVLALLLMIGALVSKLFKRNKKKHRRYIHFDADNTEPQMKYDDEDGFLNASMSFGSEDIHYDNRQLKGADIDASFGDYTIDLRDVEEIEEDTVLEVDVKFGNMDLYLPKGVNLIKNVSASFGACDVSGTPRGEQRKNIYVKGNVRFGNLDIYY